MLLKDHTQHYNENRELNTETLLLSNYIPPILSMPFMIMGSSPPRSHFIFNYHVPLSSFNLEQFLSLLWLSWYWHPIECPLSSVGQKFPHEYFSVKHFWQKCYRSDNIILIVFYQVVQDFDFFDYLIYIIIAYLIIINFAYLVKFLSTSFPHYKVILSWFVVNTFFWEEVLESR